MNAGFRGSMRREPQMSDILRLLVQRQRALALLHGRTSITETPIR
jgi:hypothetical protein